MRARWRMFVARHLRAPLTRDARGVVRASYLDPGEAIQIDLDPQGAPVGVRIVRADGTVRATLSRSARHSE